MARYLTINSKFNPITFEERMKPLLMYKEEYEKQEEALNKMLEDSQSLASLANSPQDADIYRQYQDYQSNLNGLVDNLTNNGKLDSRAALQLRRQYLQNLKPYESKLARRNELIREQAKNYTPTTMYDIDFSNIGLDSIDDSSSYRTYKLDDIAKTTASTLLSKYTSRESIGSEEDEVNSIFKDIDTTNLNNTQIDIIKSYIKQGRNAAKQTYDDYLLQQDYKKAQAEHLRRPATTRTTTSNGTKTYETRVLDSGEKIKLEKRDEDYYYNGVKVDMENLNQLSSKYGSADYAGLKGSKSYRKRPNGDVKAISAKFPSDIPTTNKAIARNMTELAAALNKLPDARDAIMSLMGNNNKLDGGLFINGYGIKIGIKDGISYIEVYDKDTSNIQQPSTIEEDENNEEIVDPTVYLNE